MPAPHVNDHPKARRAVYPWRYVYLLEAPAGVPSPGPMVVSSLDYCENLIEAGYLVTGPYVLDPSAQVQAQDEVARYRESLAGI